MKHVCISQWYMVDNHEISGYELIGVQSEKEYYSAPSKEECEKYAAENDLIIDFEC